MSNGLTGAQIITNILTNNVIDMSVKPLEDNINKLQSKLKDCKAYRTKLTNIIRELERK